MAFTVTDDMRARSRCGRREDSWNNEAFQIRQMLTERTVARLGQARVAEASRSPATAGNGSPSIWTSVWVQNHLRQLDGTPVDVTVEEQATIEALTAEHDKLEEEYADADELPDEWTPAWRNRNRAPGLEDRPVNSLRPKSPARACS